MEQQKLEHSYYSPYGYYYDGYYHPHNDAFTVVFFFILIGFFIFGIFWCWTDDAANNRGRRPRERIVYRPVYLPAEPLTQKHIAETTKTNKEPSTFSDIWNRDEV